MSYTALTVLGFSLIFLSTTLGSSLVFFFKREISEKLNTLFLGFAAGIMIAASVWSLGNMELCARRDGVCRRRTLSCAS